MLSDYINPYVFIVSFTIGVLLTYLFKPAPTVIVKYPTPYNAGKITYKDDAGTCYRYRAIKVKCNDKASGYPIQQI